MLRYVRNVMLIITGLLALGFLFATALVNSPEAKAAGRMPPEADEGNSSVSVKYTAVGVMNNETLIRVDDWERGVSCYATSWKVLSCVPMSPKTLEQRP